MARRPRLQLAGGIFHIISRGVRGVDIFHDDLDRSAFLFLLERVVEAHGWVCHAYCLMSNHYHLLIETPGENLSAGMQRFNSRYAQWFNERHGYQGHLFERRFYSVLVESNAHLIELSRYITLNPVRAGLCRHPGEWRWSSYSAMVAKAPRPRFLTVDWLLAQFGGDPDRARQAYAAFVTDAPPRVRSP